MLNAMKAANKILDLWETSPPPSADAIHDVLVEQDGNALIAVQHLYDAMLANDRELNDEAGNGTKARVPTCDDYNVLFDLVLDCAVAFGIHDPNPEKPHEESHTDL